MRLVKHLVAVLMLGALLLSADALADGMTVSRVSLGPVGGNAPTPAEYVGPWGDNSGARAFESAAASTNDWFMRTPLAEGSSAYFSTQESLVAEDTDHGQRDLYRNDGTRTELVTTGPGAGQPPKGYCGDFDGPDCGFEASRDTTHAFFSFGESLLPEDTDGGFNDLFRRFDGTTELLTTGPAATNGPFNVCLDFGSSCSRFWVSADGSRVVFATEEKLVPEDNDSDCGFTLERTCFDLYERAGGVTRLLTTGPSRAPGTAGVYISRTQFGPFPVSVDARHVFFLADRALVADDGDNHRDVYESFDGTTRLVSTGPTDSDAPVEAEWHGASADGSRAYFRMNAPLTNDIATGPGIYERSAGVTRRLPLGPPSSPFDAQGVGFFGPSYDGTHVFFSTSARLAGEDADSRRDLYSYSDHGYELISTGPAGGNGPFDVCDGGPCLEAASRDGTKVYFTTEEPLVAGDTDNVCSRFVGVPHPCEDIYVRDLSRGTTELVSTGPGPSNGVQFDFLFLDAISADGARAFFRTKMALVPQDTDGGRLDIYEHSAGRTRLVSTGPLATNAPTDARFGGSTADGRVVFFDTSELLVQGDGDFGWTDVYRVDLNEPPDCSGIAPSRSVLSTNNRKLVSVTLVGATDADGDAVSITVDGVTQDEPVTGSGDPTSPDAIDDGEGELRVRAERSPRGDGRVYRIAFTVSDGRGGSCSGSATVAVPRKKKKPAVDSAPPSYDSFGR